jgi:hypothetical protein
VIRLSGVEDRFLIEASIFMAYGRRKGWSDCIRGSAHRSIVEAIDLAEKIGRTLNVCADINWSRTDADDDREGKHGAAWRKAAGRWLRHHGAGGLTGYYVREAPDAAVRRPNTHHSIHVPMHLLDRFKRDAPGFLPKAARPLDCDAVYVQPIMPTDQDRRNRHEYLLKGTHPKARVKMKRRRIPQGRVIGKRCGFTEDIGPAARLRWQAQQDSLVEAIPF